MLRFRYLFALFAAFAVLSLVIVEADARVSRGGSSGSRGSRTFSAPPSTNTAPTGGSTFQRSVTQPNAAQPSTAPAAQPSPGLAGRPGGFFGNGLLGGLAAGFIGAGLFGMLFGHGLLGGLGGFASFLGLLLQIGLVILVARLAWAWWQRRQGQPAFASGPAMRDNAMGQGGFFGLGGRAAAAPATAPLEIDAQDFDAFERLLGEIQEAWSNEDLNVLRPRVTPEMLSYFADDLADNASRGVVNKVTGVKLLQGDLAESWREGDREYATVAMRYGLRDRYVDRATGRAAEGTDQPQEATELWTFVRPRGGNWLLSAIQQTH